MCIKPYFLDYSMYIVMELKCSRSAALGRREGGRSGVVGKVVFREPSAVIISFEEMNNTAGRFFSRNYSGLH